MITLVQCEGKKFIEVSQELPEGTTCDCPTSCEGSILCNQSGSYTVKKCKNYEETDPKVTHAIRLSQLNNSAPSVPDAESTSAPVIDALRPTPIEQNGNSVKLTSDATTNKYATRGKAILHPSPVQEEFLKPKREYKEVNIGGIVCSNDATLTRRGCRPLTFALDLIFKHWNTPFVFSSNGQTLKLNDEFVWLICQFNKNIKVEKVNRILNDSNYSKNQKFFHLFYEIVYPNQKDKLGFYWSNEYSFNTLAPQFSSLEEFALKYVETSGGGELIRAFYAAHKNEILWFFSIEEEELFNQIPLIVAKRTDRIVYIKDGAITYLGDLRTFTQNMLKPLSLKTMSVMVEFLRTYKISEKGITLRGEFDEELHVYEQNPDKVDASIYTAAKLTASAAYPLQYALLLTLIHEYVISFSPDEIEICGIKFTKSNFSEELKAPVVDFWSVHFGERNKSVENTYKGEAWLAKSLFENNVLSTFKLSNENTIRTYMDTLDNKNMSVAEYHKIFKNAKFVFRGESLSMDEYLNSILDNKELGRLNEEQITQYYSDGIKQYTPEIDKAVNAIAKLYEMFTANLKVK